MVFELETFRKLLAETPSVGAILIPGFPKRADREDPSSERSDTKQGEGFIDYDPDTLCSREDFLLHLGISHDELFCHILEENGGQLPQKEFGNYANLSSSTISRFLQEMEADGQIGRVKIGREKMVFLPEHAPPELGPVTDDSAETLRV